MTPELLTCPFCAEHPSYYAYPKGERVYIKVQCKGCDIAFDNADCAEPPPYERWNRRLGVYRLRAENASEQEIDAPKGGGSGAP